MLTFAAAVFFLIVTPGLGADLMVQAINRGAYAINTALFSGFAFYPGSLRVETLAKLLIVNAIWIPIHLGWLHAGVAPYRLNLDQTARRRINDAMAAPMLAVVILIVLSAMRTP